MLDWNHPIRQVQNCKTRTFVLDSVGHKTMAVGLAFVPPSLRSTPVRCKKTAAQKKVASWIHVVWLVSIHLATSCNSTLTQCYELHLRFVCSWELSFISLVILNESRRERWKLPRKWHVERMSTSEDKKMRWNRPDIWLYLWFGKII